MPDFDKPENAAASSGDAALVYATFPSLEIAETIGSVLVEARLAACTNIFPRMVSIYRWQGERHRDEEAAMIVKTRRELVAAVMDAIRARHPYANPALLVIPVEGGARAFLDWIREETAPESAR